MPYTKPTHKVKNNETLTGIAKKYKHKDWKNIWKAPENKKVVSLRKNPDQIQADDLLVIPFNESQKAEIAEEIHYWQTNLSAETEFTASLEKRCVESEKVIKRLNKSMDLSNQMHNSMVRDLQRTAAEAKSWGSTVDAIATVATLMVSLGKLVKTGYKAAKATGEELTKLNAKMTKDVLKMAYDPIAKQAKKAAAKHAMNEKKGYATAVVATGIVYDSFQKMTSPSFWAWTVVRLKEGDSWSDAVTYDFQAEVKQKISEINRAHLKPHYEMQKSIRAQENLIYGINQARTDSSTRMAAAKKRLKELEKIF